MKKNLLISVATLTACIATCFAQPSFAFVTSVIESAKSVVLMLGKVEKALPEAEIAKLSRQIHNAGDLPKVATSLERSGLPKVALEDTYLRITVNQGKLEKVEAEKLFGNLSGVAGFKETLRKVAGVSEMQLKGHLQELRIANRAKEQGLEVVSIGQKFDDGIKQRLTDMDLILKKDGRTFLIQSKNYESSGSYNAINLQGDAESLLQYIKQNRCENCTPIFFFTNEPPVNIRALLTKTKPDVQIIVGDAESQVIQLKTLAEVLP